MAGGRRNVGIYIYVCIEREGASVSIVDSSSIFKRKKTPGGMKYAKKWGVPCTQGSGKRKGTRTLCGKMGNFCMGDVGGYGIADYLPRVPFLPKGPVGPAGKKGTRGR